MLCSTFGKKKCLLKSASVSFRRDVLGITPSSVVANITAVRPESNVSEYSPNLVVAFLFVCYFVNGKMF